MVGGWQWRAPGGAFYWIALKLHSSLWLAVSAACVLLVSRNPVPSRAPGWRRLKIAGVLLIFLCPYVAPLSLVTALSPWLGGLLLMNIMNSDAPSWNPRGLASPFSGARLLGVLVAILLGVVFFIESFHLRYESFSMRSVERTLFYLLAGYGVLIMLGLLNQARHAVLGTPFVDAEGDGLEGGAASTAPTL